MNVQSGIPVLRPPSLAMGGGRDPGRCRRCRRAPFGLGLGRGEVVLRENFREMQHGEKHREKVRQAIEIVTNFPGGPMKVLKSKTF